MTQPQPQPLPKLAAGGKEILDKLLLEKLEAKRAPHIFWAATNAKETIYENQAGYIWMDDPSSGEVNRDTTMEIFSMTKFITCLAILQFVEKGVVSLDDPDQMYKYLPELDSMPVLEGYDDQGKAILVPQKSRITLRMLMDHTAGCTQPQLNPLLAGWYKAQEDPAPFIFDPKASVKSITAPLLFQPGTGWVYGSGTDWIGVLISRLSGLTLEQYFRQNIFDRVEGQMPDTTFYPTESIKARKVGIYNRSEDGEFTRLPGYGMGRAMTADTVSKEFLSGAGGLFGTTKDYLALCRAVLQCDPRNPNPPKYPLISAKTFGLLFEPSLKAQKSKEDAVKFFNNEKQRSPAPTVENADHSVALCLNLVQSDFGRKPMSGAWSGAARTRFWIDPTTGLAGVCNTQFFGPVEEWNRTYNEYERALYDNLEQ